MTISNRRLILAYLNLPGPTSGEIPAETTRLLIVPVPRHRVICTCLMAGSSAPDSRSHTTGGWQEAGDIEIGELQPGRTGTPAL